MSVFVVGRALVPTSGLYYGIKLSLSIIMTRSLQHGLMLSIPTWLAVTIVLGLLGELRLSATAFFAGSSLVMVLGLSLLAIDGPSKISIRTPILYSSIFLFTLSAVIFVYSYLAMNAIGLFYVALALLILGTGEVFAGVRRTPCA